MTIPMVHKFRENVGCFYRKWEAVFHLYSIQCFKYEMAV